MKGLQAQDSKDSPDKLMEEGALGLIRVNLKTPAERRAERRTANGNHSCPTVGALGKSTLALVSAEPDVRGIAASARPAEGA
jgi:hypothetical protein